MIYIISKIISEFKQNANFTVNTSCGYPKIDSKFDLPVDVKEFYNLCGGIECYIKYGAFPIKILAPQNVILANIKFFGQNYDDDISSSWYLIADLSDGNYISINFGDINSGMCYVSGAFEHGIVGQCPIIALSFSELIYKILKYEGEYFYWKDNFYFKGYGDAYDII